MKAIILAAGRGTRISRHLDNRPKCTVSLGKDSLIENTIKTLLKNNISDITMCVGYKKSIIKDVLKKYNIKYYNNPFYSVTNSIASIWFAKEALINDDLLIMNGDVYINDSLMKFILNQKKSPLLFADESRKEEADYKLKYSSTGILEKYGKHLKGSDITGEYIGIAKINRIDLIDFSKQISFLIDNEEHNLWWENVLYSMSHKKPIHVKDVEGNFWGEVDYIEDYQRILNYIDSKNK
jgi:choline kinase